MNKHQSDFEDDFTDIFLCDVLSISLLLNGFVYGILADLGNDFIHYFVYTFSL